MNNKLTTLKKHLDTIKTSKDTIIDEWVNSNDVQKVLLTHNIDKDIFKKEYAIKVLEYFIEVVEESKNIGQCPAIIELIHYFKSKNITISELFTICIKLRESMIKVLIQKKLIDIDLYNAVSFIFDNNFIGVLDVYSQTIYNANRAKERFHHIATHDHLTKIYNRQKFDSVSSYEIKRALRYKHSLSLIMFDIDNFKNVNDTYGHDVGDKVLIALVDAVSDLLRESDTFARWGGEEFVVLLPETDLDLAVLKAEDLRKIIESTKIDKVGNVTCSFGVSVLSGLEDPEQLFKKADSALYLAKNSGKNIVKSYS